MKRTYEIKTHTHHTMIALTFLNYFFESNIFREVFLLDPSAAMSVSVISGMKPFVVVTINNQPEESLATLIKMIEAAGFVKEVVDI